MAPGLFLAWMAGAPCEDARRLHEALSPERALEMADHTLGLDRSRPLECLEVRALALLVLGRGEDARGVFAELFSRDPDRHIDDPSLSPQMWLLIEAARDASRPLLAQVSARWLNPARLRLDIGLDGALRGARAVRWRAVGGGLAFDGVSPLIGRSATATIAVGTEVALDALGVSGSVVAAGGAMISQLSADVLLGARPLPVIAVDEDDGVRWWLWGGLLVVVAAAATTASAVALSSPEPPDTNGTIGRVDLR